MPEDRDPFLTRRRNFLRDIGGRSDQWYLDRVNDPEFDPPLPKTIRIGKDAFIRTADGKAYMRMLERKAGLPVVGRPPLAAARE